MKLSFRTALVFFVATAAGCKRRDDTACRQAYREVTAMVASLEQSLGPSQQRSPRPTEDQYVAQCLTLPEAAQRCAAMSYAAAHGPECAQYRANSRAPGAR